MTADARPLVSVIVTCYNYGRYVAGAIKSALAQTYPRVEVIVVNDGSTDDSLAVIRCFESQITLIDQPNAGSIAAYNRGFAEASGELFILLDADDRLEPTAVEQVVSVWDERVAKVQWDLGIIDAHGRDLGRHFCHFGPDYDSARVRDSFRRTGTYRWPVSVGNAYSRWFAEQVFPLSPEHGPDGALNTVAPVYGDVITIPRVLGRYRVHGQNMWSNTGSDSSRLPARIAQRASEVALMARHARSRGVALPSENALDHEIAFVNYRMMAKSLGLDYIGSEHDTRLGLLRRALGVLERERLPAKLTLAHTLWFSAMAVASRTQAERLVRWRFQRGQRQK